MKNPWKAPFPEIPNLVFTEIDGVAMFDPEFFLRQSELDSKEVKTYFKECRAEIDKYVEGMDISQDGVMKTGPGGALVIHSALAMSFICWASVDAKLYCLESFRNLLGDGFATSNRYIASEAGHRFGVDVNKVVNGED